MQTHIKLRGLGFSRGICLAGLTAFYLAGTGSPVGRAFLFLPCSKSG
jgi:hypothetical protein